MSGSSHFATNDPMLHAVLLLGPGIWSSHKGKQTVQINEMEDIHLIKSTIWLSKRLLDHKAVVDVMSVPKFKELAAELLSRGMQIIVRSNGFIVPDKSRDARSKAMGSTYINAEQ